MTLFRQTKLSKLLLISSLKLHSFSYKLSSYFAIKYFGAHPKHRIINYFKWFNDLIGENDVVIDIGSNTGAMVFELAKKPRRTIYGIEIDKKYSDIAVANNTCANVQFFCADATTFDYQHTPEIDVITMSNVLEHISDGKNFLKKIVTAVSWSVSGAKILIRVPALDREWPVLMKKELGIEYRLDRTHYTEYTNKEIYSVLAYAGLEISTIERSFGEIYIVCVKNGGATACVS